MFVTHHCFISVDSYSKVLLLSPFKSGGNRDTREIKQLPQNYTAKKEQN